ncbi:TLC domain [Trypanosoma vivax]|uniref:TLC domain-containing protein n=1 Tax=Trypanosoma vivax (strain Y486) TaxID=1055687 RepID=G0TUW4_TRYVY|nr:TLC domain [Trypanosoma vivax]CCC47751.1 conserved hypothetical protein [Trypanosoma vivax Y486]
MTRYTLDDMYAMPPERAREYGFVSYYNHTGDTVRDSLANNLELTSEQWRQLLVNPVGLATRLGGWGGVGLDLTALPQLLPCFLWALLFLVVRLIAQTWLSRLGIWLQVVVPRGRRARPSAMQRRRLKKFQNQLWLAVYYTASTVFGYAVQYDKPWFGLPVGLSNRVAFLTPHPYNPGPELLNYYRYGLGFYVAEMVALILEHDMRRSDFAEYFVHHIVTFALMILSHCSYEHRFGAYVLFIHDASDIMLAVGKAMIYVSRAMEARERKAAVAEGGAVKHAAAPSPIFRALFSSTSLTICLAIFLVLFVFFRLVCLPCLALANLVLGVKIRMFTWSYCVLILLLQVALQGLHLYWFAIIMKIAIQTLKGKPAADVRSDDDDD